jgi:hypothetical protein
MLNLLNLVGDTKRKMKKYLLLFFITFVLTTYVFSSEVTLTPQFPLKSMPPATLTLPPVTNVRLGKFNIQLESTKLDDVLKTIKTGIIQHEGDASESVYWLCYQISDVSNPVRIWIMSGEIDGGYVGTIVICRASIKDKPTQTCPELPAAFRPVKIDCDIWLKSKISDFKRLFGKPSLTINNWVHYESKRKVLVRGSDSFEFGSLSAKFVEGRAVELWISKTTNN